MGGKGRGGGSEGSAMAVPESKHVRVSDRFEEPHHDLAGCSGKLAMYCKRCTYCTEIPRTINQQGVKGRGPRSQLSRLLAQPAFPITAAARGDYVASRNLPGDGYSTTG